MQPPDIISQESPLRRRLRLAWRVVATSFDVGLMVIGSALVALAAVVLLDGFDVFDLNLTTSTAQMLGSGLVIAVFGAFAIGVAVEGPVREARAISANELELALARGGSLIVVGLVLLWLGKLGEKYIDDLPHVFDQAIAVVIAAGTSGFTFTLVVGLAALWGARRLFADRYHLDRFELPVLYVVWAVGTAIVFGMLQGA